MTAFINLLLLHLNFAEHFPPAGMALPVSYDYGLVALSYFIAAVAGYTGLNLSYLVRERARLQRHSTGLLAIGSIAMGLGIWAMHFLAMLAYSIGIPVSYDPLITAVSLLPAILASLVAVRAMSSHELTLGRLLGQGLIIGLGIGLMHYLGMAAMIQDATPYYHTGMFILSLVVAWLLGSFTLYIRFSPWLDSHLPQHAANILTALLWGAAVAGMHYTGMAAMFFLPGCSVQLPAGIPAGQLATPVAAVTLLLILSALAFVLFQHKLMSVNYEAELNRERMRDAVDEMSDGFMLVDGQQCITLANRQLHTLFPGSESLLQPGQPITGFVDWLKGQLADSASVRDLLELTDADAVSGEPRHLKLQDGRWLMLRHNLMRSGARMLTWSDITTLKQAEEALFQEDKMVSLGRMVSGVAHEVNTPLGISLTLASQLEEETRQVRAAYEKETVSQQQFERFLNNTETISNLLLANVRRAADLIRNFKQVAVDQSHLVKETIPLKSYTGQVLHTLHSEYKALNPQIDINGPDTLQLETLPGAYAQVIINLVKNSVLHGLAGVAQPRISIDIEDLGGQIAVHYRDNGTGMSEEVLEKLYDPFFTTKRSEGGTGLGMHIVFNLVTQKLRGNIKAESTPGEGVHITLLLPKNYPD